MTIARTDAREQLPTTASQSLLDAMRAAEHPRCLMCGAVNPFGMKIAFEVQPDGSVRAEVPCQTLLQSYPETLHGGVIAAMLDAAMTNAIFAVGVAAVTAELEVRFIAPVRLDRVVVLGATIERSAACALYYARATLEQQGQLMARATAKFLAKDYR